MARIDVKVVPELYNLIAEKADAESLATGASVSLGAVLVRIVAEHFGRPDLAKVPRMGRPRKEVSAQAS